MLITGLALAIASDRLARWATPVPRAGCPRCGYEKIEQDRCPECGLGGFGPRE
jgi:hypothetical protein